MGIVQVGIAEDIPIAVDIAMVGIVAVDSLAAEEDSLAVEGTTGVDIAPVIVEENLVVEVRTTMVDIADLAAVDKLVEEGIPVVERTMVVVGDTLLAELHTARVLLVALHTMVVVGRLVVAMAQPMAHTIAVLLQELRLVQLGLRPVLLLVQLWVLLQLLSLLPRLDQEYK